MEPYICKTIVCVFLLLIVVFAVEQAVPAVTGPAQRAQTHRALDAGLVPGTLVDAQQEAVGDGSLAAGTQLPPSSALRTCRDRPSCGCSQTTGGLWLSASRRFTKQAGSTPCLTNTGGPEFFQTSGKAPEYHFSRF